MLKKCVLKNFAVKNFLLKIWSQRIEIGTKYLGLQKTLTGKICQCTLFVTTKAAQFGATKSASVTAARWLDARSGFA